MQILDGHWWLATDPGNFGKAQHWFVADPASGDTIPGAQPAAVPGAIRQTFPNYSGVAWYWHHFTPLQDPGPAERALLHFHGNVRYLGEAWLNGAFVGGYEGGECGFDLDVTGALRPAQDNLLAVRVLMPGQERIEEYVLNELPMGGDYGGIMMPVDFRIVPSVRTVDLFARPNPHDGTVPLTVTLRNDSAVPVECRLVAEIGAALPTGLAVENRSTETVVVAPGEQTMELSLRVSKPHLWNLDDPFLYRVAVRLDAALDSKPVTDYYAVRCGFRAFKVERGFFRLNGRRIYLRQTHTGNHMPYSQNAPVQLDLVRRDFTMAKASGFNSVRYIKGAGWPEQLDFCDELGLLVYEECGGSWLMKDSPHFAKRYNHNMDDLIRRDRNHPCLAIWGVLNETRDGPVFRHAVGYLKRLRELDPTRLVLLSSGRWDGHLEIGSLSNPGSSEWEHEWGAEAPDAPTLPFARSTWEQDVPAYADGTGDAHVYPYVPHTDFSINFIRTLGSGTKPVFLSEYGIGSMMNVVREARKFEQDRARPDLADVATITSWAEKLNADWQRWGFDGVYPFVEDLLRDSQRLHLRQRQFGFDLIRSNPNICGFNVTGMLDHGLSGEGLWTFTREWKPGIADVLCDGWSPVRWCLLIDPMHAYAGRTIKVEAILSNEDVLPPGVYPAAFRITGPSGVVWEKRLEFTLPEAPAGGDPPLAVPVLFEEITLNGPAGTYRFTACLERGGAPEGGRLNFHLSSAIPPAGEYPDRSGAQSKAAASPIDELIAERQPPAQRATTWGIEPRVVDWLVDRGVACLPFDPQADQGPADVILVGRPDGGENNEASWAELIRRVDEGSAAVFLDPRAFARGEDPVGWLPLANKGRCYEFRDWIYHKECVAKPHPILARLQPPRDGNLTPGIMDWEYYGQVISHWMFEGQDTPDETIIAAFAAGYIPGGYFSGVLMGAYRHGAGRFILNTLAILEHIDRHPAADRLLLNLIDYSSRRGSK